MTNPQSRFAKFPCPWLGFYLLQEWSSFSFPGRSKHQQSADSHESYFWVQYSFFGGSVEKNQALTWIDAWNGDRGVVRVSLALYSHDVARRFKGLGGSIWGYLHVSERATRLRSREISCGVTPHAWASGAEPRSKRPESRSLAWSLQ